MEKQVSPDSHGISSSSSSVTLPMAAHNSEDSKVDLEKMATEKSREAGHPTTKVKTALDWTGDDDEENPENWSTGKKAYHIAYVGLQCFVVYVDVSMLWASVLTSNSTFGSSVYTPAIAEVARQFAVSIEVATLPLTLYLIGLGFGPTISAPISETFGRKIVYLTLFPVALLFTLGSGLAQSFATLNVCRFFAGAIGSGALAVGAGTNSDLYPPLKRAPVASVFLLAPFAGPALGKPIRRNIVQILTLQVPLLVAI